VSVRDSAASRTVAVSMSTVARAELPAPARPRRQWRNAFTVLGSEPEAAEDFADRVIAWRTPHRTPRTVKHFFTSVLSLTEDSQIGANLRIFADEEDRATFDQRG
jgi:hypothetical protein